VFGAVTSHDRKAAPPDRGPAIEVALSGLRLQGAIFLRGEYSGAWAYISFPPGDAKAVLAPESKRFALFHLIAEGRTWIRTPRGEPHWAQAGDVVVLPYNDPHLMGGSEPAEPALMANLLDSRPWQQMPVVRLGGPGEVTRIVCGYLTSDHPLFDPRLRALPPVFVVRPPDGPTRDWVRASIHYAMAQTALVGGDHIESPTTIPQLLLVEVLRLHLADAPAEESGWLAALEDPVLAASLSAMHAEPDRKWNLVDLARHSGVSVSHLDDRFREVIGLAPIRYLSAWRMHLARDLLRSTQLPVVAVARRVGYDSEEAFSRAFKRANGQPPSAWRESA
jgi:AraC-like DNA-binding protein